MQAITTKYHGAGNKLGSRVSATSASGIRKYLEWDDRLSSDENHEAAALALCVKLNWSTIFSSGGLLKDGTRVHIMGLCVHLPALSDESTKVYRENQLDRAIPLRDGHCRNIKITGTKDSTNYLAVTDAEFSAIRQILTRK